MRQKISIELKKIQQENLIHFLNDYTSILANSFVFFLKVARTDYHFVDLIGKKLKKKRKIIENFLIKLRNSLDKNNNKLFITSDQLYEIRVACENYSNCLDRMSGNIWEQGFCQDVSLRNPILVKRDISLDIADIFFKKLEELNKNEKRTATKTNLLS